MSGKSISPARKVRQTPFNDLPTSVARAPDRHTVETAAIVSQWGELLRLEASIEAGVVVPSVILRKLAAAGGRNALSRALRELGRIERTLFTLQWLSDPDLRQRSHAGLNLGHRPVDKIRLGLHPLIPAPAQSCSPAKKQNLSI